MSENKVISVGIVLTPQLSQDVVNIASLEIRGWTYSGELGEITTVFKCGPQNNKAKFVGDTEVVINTETEIKLYVAGGGGVINKFVIETLLPNVNFIHTIYMSFEGNHSDPLLLTNNKAVLAYLKDPTTELNLTPFGAAPAPAPALVPHVEAGEFGKKYVKSMNGGAKKSSKKTSKKVPKKSSKKSMKGGSVKKSSKKSSKNSSKKLSKKSSKKSLKKSSK